MTIEKTIEWFHNFIDNDGYTSRHQEACRMAISALREQQLRENPKPLTLDELRQMDGEPVYLVDLIHKSDPEVSDLWSGWIVFINHNQNGFIPRSGGFFSVYGYGKNWLAYRHKPKEVQE